MNCLRFQKNLKMTTKSLRLSPSDLVKSRAEYTMLSILKEKGFPIKGTFHLEVDWDKVEAMTSYLDDKTLEQVIEWKEKGQ